MPLPGALCVWRLSRTGRLPDSLWLAGATVSAELILHVLGTTFHRPRPEPFFGLPKPDSFSFPSGHALMCTVFYLLLAQLTSARPAIRAAAIAFVLLVGFSRAYLGFHFPTDVLAGFAAGTFWLSACAILRSYTGRSFIRDYT
jgi:undecaprenyl-diphosphatase